MFLETSFDKQPRSTLRLFNISRTSSILGAMDITFDSNTEGKNTVGKPWALTDGKIGILTKLDKFLNLLRQYVSSSSNNSKNTSLCLSVSYVHEV